LTIDWVVLPGDDQQRMTVAEATSEMADGGTISTDQEQVSSRWVQRRNCKHRRVCHKEIWDFGLEDNRKQFVEAGK